MTQIQVITKVGTFSGESDLHTDEVTRLIHSCSKDQLPLRIELDGIMYVFPPSTLDESVFRITQNRR